MKSKRQPAKARPAGQSDKARARGPALQPINNPSSASVLRVFASLRFTPFSTQVQIHQPGV